MRYAGNIAHPVHGGKYKECTSLALRSACRHEVVEGGGERGAKNKWRVPHSR